MFTSRDLIAVEACILNIDIPTKKPQDSIANWNKSYGSNSSESSSVYNKSYQYTSVISSMKDCVAIAEKFWQMMKKITSE